MPPEVLPCQQVTRYPQRGPRQERPQAERPAGGPQEALNGLALEGTMLLEYHDREEQEPSEPEGGGQQVQEQEHGASLMAQPIVRRLSLAPAH